MVRAIQEGQCVVARLCDVRSVLWGWTDVLGGRVCGRVAPSSRVGVAWCG
jgi:hypothetical protein